LVNELARNNVHRVEILINSIIPEACVDPKFKLGINFFIENEKVTNIKIPYEIE
jgi:hypothetical protein